MKLRVRLFSSALVTAGLLILLTSAVAFAGVNANPPVIADFEGGVPTGWFQYGDGGAVVNAVVTTIAAGDPLALPGQIGNNDVLAVTANVPTWAGFGAGLNPAQDWSDYEAVSFWHYGENSGTVHEFEIQTANAGNRRATFMDDFTGWRQIILPFHTFGAGGAYDVSQVTNWVFVLDGTVGSFHFDNLQLVNLQPFANFEGSVPAGWFQYSAGGANVVNATVSTILDTAPLALPGQVGANDILSVTANVPDWAGFGAGFTPVQDWSEMQGVSFWFYGENSDTTHEFEIQTANAGNRRAIFVDNFTGWRMIVLPFTTFGDTPYDVSQVTNWVFVLDGTIGFLALDYLSVYGDAGNIPVRVQFDPAAYTVYEGQTATITVKLNIVSPDPVNIDYATVDGDAVAGTHYTATAGTLTFASGVQVQSFTVSTIDNDLLDGNKELQLVLSNPVNAELGNNSTAALLIRDNEQAPPTVVGSPREIIDDYEYTNGLPAGADGDGNGIGFVTWNAPGASAGVALTVPAQQVPGKATNNQVLQLDLNLGAGQWGGFSHAFENEAVDAWVSQDWSRFEGVAFWLYGNNTGSIIFVDLQENRNPGSTSDDAERWSVDIPDDFSGWRYFQIPFTQFNRKDIGNGAPNDGFDGKEMWGYAFGGFNTIDNQSYFIDDFTLYGNMGGLQEELRVAFSAARFSVIEGATAVMTVSLNMTSTTPVTVTYATAEGQATTGVDYTPVSGGLVFAPGEQHRTIQVPTIDDDKHEPTERLMVNLTSVEGAVFAFQRRAMLEIEDNDPANPDKLDDFEGFHPFQKVGDVTLSITQLAAGDPDALPGQGALEQVLTVQYDNTAATANRIFNFFTQPQDWSGADGLTFWYFGGATGNDITVELWDNQITTTNNLTSTEWVLRWSDEFNEPAGTPPNPNNWRHEIGDGTLNNIPGWGNSEFQFYTDDPANASTDGNGNLVLRMSKVNTETTSLLCYYGPCRYTSARLISADRADFQYGKIEARIKLPPTTQSGIWPAFWALGTNINDPGVGWPQSGEIDIMEYVSRVPNEIFGTLHGPGYSGGASFGSTINIPNLLDDYHVYTIEWRENHIIWYVDGVKYHEARDTSPFLSGKEWVFNHPFFLLLNVAIGGNLGGAISDQMTFPQDTLVDWVRVYQAPNQAELFEASFADDFTGWQKIVIPFTAFTRSTEQPAGAPNDGLTLTEVNGYGFRFPHSGRGVVAQTEVIAHIDQVSLLNFTGRWWFALILSGASSSQ